MIEGFDWRDPDYSAVFAQRQRRAIELETDPALREALKLHYANNPCDFIDDWGVTFDPRNVELGLPGLIPFVLFPKQREWIEWLVAHWRGRRPGITEKSRDCGASWIAVSFSVWMCVFHRDASVGFGSRKQEYVDLIGAPKALLVRARMFINHLPGWLRAGANDDTMPHMRIQFPETGSFIGGEVGDSIGRGDRTSIYFVDESAYLENPELADYALSQTTNCRIDVSSVNGLANSFAQRRFSGKIDVFTFHWRDDPRKDEAWYRKQCEEHPAVVIAQELDIDYASSTEGVLIPSAWVQAAVDAHVKLGFEPTGKRMAALDVADEGPDLNGFIGAKGVLVEVAEDWSGKGDDIYGTVVRAFHLCDDHGYTTLAYDADGLGAGVRGDARVINSKRPADRQIVVQAFRGSGEIVDPEQEDVKGRRNEDFFKNAKAQSWWSLRTRFQKTHRWVVDGVACSPDDIISISSKLKNLVKLTMELSQPTYGLDNAGKIVVNKKPDGARSPNLADGVMVRYARRKRAMIIPGAVLERSRRVG